jgi:hypothetical protein
VNVRPKTGTARSTEKKLADVSVALILSDSSAPVRRHEDGS